MVEWDRDTSIATPGPPSAWISPHVARRCSPSDRRQSWRCAVSTLWCNDGAVLTQPLTRVPLCRAPLCRSVDLRSVALSCFAGALEAGIRGPQRSGTRVPRRSALCSNCRPLPVQYPQLVSFTAASPATGGRDVLGVTCGHSLIFTVYHRRLHGRTGLG